MSYNVSRGRSILIGSDGSPVSTREVGGRPVYEVHDSRTRSLLERIVAEVASIDNGPTATLYPHGDSTPLSYGDSSLDSRWLRLRSSTPNQIVGNMTDFPRDGSSGFLRVSADSNGRRIISIASGNDGETLKILNTGSAFVVLRHQDTAGTTNCRIVVPYALDLSLAQYQWAELIYDYSINRWLVIGASDMTAPGTVIDYAGTTAPPGYLACDGTAYTAATYSGLSAALPTLAGAVTWGNSGSNVTVPDLRRRVTAGSGGSGTATLGNAVGNVGGEETHTIAVTELPAHTHGLSSGNFRGTLAAAVSFTNAAGQNAGGVANTDSGTGGAGAANVIQPTAITTKAIKI